MYQIGIFTIWPEPDSGRIVESASRHGTGFYRIVM